MTWRVKHKLDANQPAIVAALRDAGYAVQALEQGKGCPDLLVAERANGTMTLLEVKMPGGTLTSAQVDWIEIWPSAVHLCGKRDLEWNETPEGWRLFTQTGNLHQCKTLAHRRASQKGTST